MVWSISKRTSFMLNSKSERSGATQTAHLHFQKYGQIRKPESAMGSVIPHASARHGYSRRTPRDAAHCRALRSTPRVRRDLPFLNFLLFLPLRPFLRLVRLLRRLQFV